MSAGTRTSDVIVAPAGGFPVWWIALAVVIGALIGSAAVVFPAALVIAPALAAVPLLVVTVLRRLDLGVLLLVGVVSLDVAGRISTGPLTITVFQVLLVLCLLSWIVSWQRDGRPAPDIPAPFAAALALVLAAAAWSLPFSNARLGTVLGGGRLFFLSLLALLIVDVVRTRRLHDRVIAVVVGTATFMAAITLVQWLAPAVLAGAGAVLEAPTAAERPSAFFDDPNFLAALLAASLVVAAVRVVHARTTRAALPWLATMPVVGAALALTLSRTGWAGVAVGLAVAVFTAPRSRRIAAVASLVLLVVAVAAFAPQDLADRAAAVLEPTEWDSLETRLLLYTSTAEMAADHWVFGVGLTAFDDVYPTYREPGATYDIEQQHEVPLSFVAETGLFGLFAEVVLLGYLGTIVFRRRREWDPATAAALAGFTALAAGMLFQNYLYFEYVWLFAALLVAADRTALRGETQDV